jgi:deoxycytidylate deaminase
MAFAERVARKFSNEDRHLVAALQIRGGNIVNYGINRLQYKRGSSYFDCSIHAEVDLARKSGFSLNGDKICIYRFNRAQETNDYRDSKPCPLCVRVLFQSGAGKVYYSLNNKVLSSKVHSLPMLAVDPIMFTKQYIPKYSTESTRHMDFDGYLI